MIARKDHFAAFLADQGIVKAVRGVGLIYARTFSMPLICLGRTHLGVRYCGPCGALMTIAMMIFMSFAFMILFALLGVLTNPVAALTGTGVSMRSPVIFDYFTKLVVVVMLWHLLTGHVQERARRIHTRSSGYCWLGELACLWTLRGWNVRLFAEPIAWAVISLAASNYVDPVLGLYLKLATVALALNNYIEFAAMREIERDIVDGEIEVENYRAVVDGRARAGDFVGGIATPDVTIDHFHKQIASVESGLVAYGPGDDPSLRGLWREVGDDEFRHDLRRADEEGMQDLLRAIDRDLRAPEADDGSPDAS